MTETMRERVAKAITAKRFSYWFDIPVDSPRVKTNVDENWRVVGLDLADAAIAAMREEDLTTELAHRKFLKLLDANENGCWDWKGSIDRKDGYGHFYYGLGKTGVAHRFSYKYYKGEIPDGLVVDHICRNRACVNPDHLRTMTNATNVMIGEGPTAKFARAFECKRGHSMDDDNTYIRPNGQRQCRKCQTDRSRKSKAKRRLTA